MLLAASVELGEVAGPAVGVPLQLRAGRGCHEEGDRGENHSDVPHRNRSCHGLLTGTHECVRDAHVPRVTRGKSIDALSSSAQSDEYGIPAPAPVQCIRRRAPAARCGGKSQPIPERRRGWPSCSDNWTSFFSCPARAEDGHTIRRRKPEDSPGHSAGGCLRSDDQAVQ
jgi:hypothetical protein